MSKNAPKTREAALINICKPLADLQAQNEIFYKGQLIIATVGDQSGIKRGDWDWLTDAPEAATPFNDLPWVVPISSTATAAMPIKLRSTDAGYAVVSGEVVFTHAGLVDITDPVITCTQLGGELRDADFTHDGEAGTLTIHILDSLNPTDHVTVISATKLPISDVAADQEARIRKLEYFTSPLSIVGGGAIWIWRRPANQIPAGWREVTELRGKTIFGFNPDDAAFNAIWTKTGGDKGAIMGLNNLIEHDHDQYLSVSDIQPEIGSQIEANRFKSASDRGLYKKKAWKTGKTGQPAPDPINILNPYRVVMFIEPDPDYVIPS